MRFLIVALLAGCGCCHPMPPPAPPQPAHQDMASEPDMKPNIYGLPNCSTSIQVTYADVCDGMFTKVGLSCAICHGGAACYDSSDGIYCASGKPGCLDDNACLHVEDGEDGSPGAQAKKKAKKPNRIRLKQSTSHDITPAGAP